MPPGWDIGQSLTRLSILLTLKRPTDRPVTAPISVAVRHFVPSPSRRFSAWSSVSVSLWSPSPPAELVLSRVERKVQGHGLPRYPALVKVDLPFGRGLRAIDVPDASTVLLPAKTRPLADPLATVREVLQRPTAGRPLRERCRPGQSVAIVVSDITRPVPNQLLLPLIVEELFAAGVAESDITIVNGTGLHRPNSDDELRWMLGDDICRRFRIVQHEARRPETLTRVGVSGRGVPVELCSAYVEADFRVVTGFVEPHLFAGYSGGAKGVMPGVAGDEIVMSNHGAGNLAHPRATWCTSDGNPVFEEMRELTALCPPDFLLNITLDSERNLTGVFAGDWAAAHDAAIGAAARQYKTPIPSPFDVVVVTNMGFPADTTLYQSVKGMSVAAEAVREGGAIILVAGCEEGLGGPEYVDFLASRGSPADLLADILGAERPRHDQWQVQIQANVQRKARVFLHSLLSPKDTARAHLEFSADPTGSVRDLVADARARGRPGSVLVMPFGQLAVPVIRAS
jgi:nickel-dependent lactate racemase